MPANEFRPAIRDFGDRALLAECPSTAGVLALADILRAARPAGLAELVPAARTVLLVFETAAARAAGRDLLGTLTVALPPPPAAGAAADVVVEVRYDGPDLAEVAGYLGMGVDDLVSAHTGTLWQVGFGGFAPGFAYLVGGRDWAARVGTEIPRRGEPRTRVPAGSVGLAGEFSGVYPRESPGGWQLIGRTGVVLWDAGRPRPALLVPGMRVRFRAVAELRP